MNIETFVKKPIKVEAVLLTEFNIHHAKAWANEIQPADKQIEFSYNPNCGQKGDCPYIGLIIPTKEGDMLCSIGDYLIKEPFPTDDRMFYPCKPNMHYRTYDKI